METLVIVKDKWSPVGPEEILGGILCHKALSAEEVLEIIQKGHPEFPGLHVESFYSTREYWFSLLEDIKKSNEQANH